MALATTAKWWVNEGRVVIASGREREAWKRQAARAAAKPERTLSHGEEPKWRWSERMMPTTRSRRRRS